MSDRESEVATAHDELKTIASFGVGARLEQKDLDRISHASDVLLNAYDDLVKQQKVLIRDLDSKKSTIQKQERRIEVLHSFWREACDSYEVINQTATEIEALLTRRGAIENSVVYTLALEGMLVRAQSTLKLVGGVLVGSESND